MVCAFPVAMNSLSTCTLSPTEGCFSAEITLAGYIISSAAPPVSCNLLWLCKPGTHLLWVTKYTCTYCDLCGQIKGTVPPLLDEAHCMTNTEHTINDDIIPALAHLIMKS